MKKLIVIAALLMASPVYAQTAIKQAEADKTFADRHPLVTKIGADTKKVTKPVWAPIVCVSKKFWNEKHVKSLRGDCVAIEHKTAQTAQKISKGLEPYSGLINTGSSIANGMSAARNYTRGN